VALRDHAVGVRAHGVLANLHDEVLLAIDTGMGAEVVKEFLVAMGCAQIRG
jgi:hypothetical protein